jgi:GNAT superfamily N-acetyltransferase
MEIAEVVEDNMEHIVKLMQGYFKFYRIEPPSPKKILSLSKKLCSDPQKGKQFLIYTEKDKPVGFVTLYFVMSTLSQSEVVLMNDLYVEKEFRGMGYGKALFEHAMTYTQTSGYSKMEWMTEPENHRARKFYSDRGGKWSEWIYFSLEADTNA